MFVPGGRFGGWVCNVASEPYASETDNIISSHGPGTIAEEACEQKLPDPILLIREMLVSKVNPFSLG